MYHLKQLLQRKSNRFVLAVLVILLVRPILQRWLGDELATEVIGEGVALLAVLGVIGWKRRAEGWPAPSAPAAASRRGPAREG